jgi:uracil-DNA glycosylase
MNPAQFVAHLARIRLPNVFNPYAETCERDDLVGAPRIRQQNLELLLTAAIALKVDTLWIGRDLGHRGGRRTGLALTDEVHLDVLGTMFGGLSLRRATSGAPVAEQTAAVIWRALERIDEPILLWNVFPFHPHYTGRPFSNRAHSSAERALARPFLKDIVRMLRPKRLVGIGRDAEKAISGFDIAVARLRHPSYGGQSEFLAGALRLCPVDS